MPRIVAIEADPQRQQALTALVLDQVKTSFVVVPTVRAAIACIAKCTPDLITLPIWLSPPDEAELLGYMKALDSAPYIQMLTVPVLDMDGPGDALAETRRRGVFGRVFNRRAVAKGLPYDPRVLAAQIAESLARARELRLEYAATLAVTEALNRRVAQDSSLALATSGSPRLIFASRAGVEQDRSGRAREERRVASRKARGDVPWLSGIRLWSGPELELINISNTGVLVETGSKLPPGTMIDLQICGTATNLVVPARFMRSDVARVDGRGVRYLAAAAFATELDIDGRGNAVCREGRTAAAPSDELAALFGAVLSSTRNEPAHAQFAQGLRQLVGARDVRVTRELSEASGGRDSLYFDLPGDDRAGTALQVMFDRSHAVTDVELRTLKAGACLTAAVLELEKPVSAHAGAIARIARRLA
jgi:hypothetical protein